MVELPESIFQNVRSGNAVLCTGVRFAEAAKMPGWEALIQEMEHRLKGANEGLAPIIQSGKLLTATGFLKRKLGKESIAELIKTKFNGKGDVSTVHAPISNLPFYAAINTGYDPLWEQTWKKSNGSSSKVYSYTDGAFLRVADDLKHFVVKAHGDCSRPEQMVLTQADYKHYIEPNQSYRAFIEELYRTHSFFFLGYTLNDPDFVLFIDRLATGFRDAVTDHYAFLWGTTPVEREELYANYRIRVIDYTDGKKDAGKALIELVQQLSDEWKRQGGGALDAPDPAIWLKQQLGVVDVRIDAVAGQGLSLTEGRLNRINETAARADLAKLDGETLCRLGNIRLHLHDAPGAVACYTKALESRDTVAVAHLNLHHANAELRQFGKALEHLQQAMKLDESLRMVPKRFEIKAVIGRGTTGTVYHAHDTKEKRDVTLKVLRMSYVREYVSPEMWLEQMQGVKKLSHRHVAKVYDAFIEGRRCIIVAESLNGQSLDRLVREKGALSFDRCLKIFLQVCEGLTHAHEHGVFHLDITPSNIFMCDDGRVVTMDFRSGRAQRGRDVRVLPKSDGFQAPELFTGEGVDARADVFSLGATLYYALTAHYPIGSYAKAGEVNANARRFETVIARAMRRIPDERPKTVAEFAKLLEGSAEDVKLPTDDGDLMGWLEVLTYHPDHEQATEALDRLESRYRKAKDWDHLVTLLLGKVEIETDHDRRLEILSEVARVFESEVGDIAKAFAALQAAFREDPTNLELRKDLERLAGATGMWSELLQEYSTVVQSQRDPKIAGDWWVRIGQLYNNELGHDDYAAAAFRNALALDANRMDALTALAEIVKRTRDMQEYVRLLSRQITLEENVARKVELQKELARLYSKELGSDEQAMITYRALLQLDPNNKQALSEVQALYEKAEMWEELSQLLRTLVESTKDATVRAKYRQRLAEILGERLSATDEAVVQLQHAVEETPEDMAILKQLERLYDATNRHQDYLKILDKRINAAQSVEEKIALYQRIATEWEAQSGGRSKAAEYLEKVHELGGANEESCKRLVRLYWELERYDRLTEAYQQQIKLAERPDDKKMLFAALGRVYDEHLKNKEQAVKVYQNLLALDATNRIALDALADLYSATEKWSDAVSMLEKLTRLEGDVDKQANDYYRLGRIQFDRLDNADEAERNLSKALELQGGNLPAMVMLAELYRRRKDYGKAGRMLREAARHTTNQLERVKRLFDTADVYLNKLHNLEQAIEALEELMSYDPEHVGGGELLVDLYERHRDFAKAVPVLEMLIRKSDPQDRKRIYDLNIRLGKACVAEDRADRALKAFEAAYELEPTAQEALRLLADVRFNRGDVDQAAKLYQALLVHQRDALPAADVVEVYYRLGLLKVAEHQTEKALSMFEKALEVDPTKREVIDEAIAIYETKKDLEAVLQCRKRQLDATKDDEKRIEVCETIGHFLLDKLQRPDEAIAYYKKALQIRPDHRTVLYSLMDAYIKQKQWEDAIQVLREMERFETDATHSYRLHYTAAVILRDELGRLDEAAHHFELALQCEPTNKKALNGLRKTYTKQKNYKALAEAYRRTLTALEDAAPVTERVQLLHELGELFQHRLNNPKEAALAFELAAKLDPFDVKRHEALAQLYATAGLDDYEKAVQVNQQLIAQDPMKLDAYRELRRLYAQKGEQDKAWCCAAVLSLLKQASDDEMKFYQKHRPPQLRYVNRKIPSDLWREAIFHPRQHCVLNELFAVTSPVVTSLALKDRKSLPLKEKDRVRMDQDSRPLVQVLEHVRGVLTFGPDEFYVRTDGSQKIGIELVSGEKQQAVLLWALPALLESPQRDLAYWYGKTLSVLAPEMILSVATPSPTVLRAIIVASLKILEPSIRLSGDVSEIMRLVEVFKKQLSPVQIERLGKHLDELRALTSEEAIERWMSGVELTSARVGLILCDDLETAARLVSTESGALQRVSAKERLAHLMGYAVSEEYFRVRALLGLQITPR